jgi:hypothetical protein
MHIFNKNSQELSAAIPEGSQQGRTEPFTLLMMQRSECSAKAKECTNGDEIQHRQVV